MEQGITGNIVDLSADTDAIKHKHGDRYYAQPEAHAEAARLWGAVCNDCGVVTDVTECLGINHNRFSAEIRLCQTAKGYYLVGMSLTTPEWGFGSPPTVWDRYGFANLGAARRWALDFLINRLTFSNGGNSAEAAKKEFLRRLEEAKTPQLSLF